jgi:ABC-type multidrug transport system permease subunit
MFGAAQPMMLSFPFERPMFLREYGTGTYSARAYFLSKWTLELPLALAQVLTQYIIVYNLIGFQGSFVQLVIAALLNGVTASSLALVVGCAVPNVKTVTELAPLLFVPQLLFSGFFIRTELVPVFLRWAQYLCGLKYSLNLIVLTEFDPGNDNCSDSVAAATNCATLLSANQVHKEEYWIYLGLLLAVFFLFRITAGFILIGKANKFY